MPNNKMAQGNKKFGSRPGGGGSRSPGSHKVKAKAKLAKVVKVGNPMVAPKKKSHYNIDYLEEKQLSKEIDKANEKKMAAKIIQDGGHLSTADLKMKGKELNKEQRRSQVKKKLTRVEEKLVELKQKAEREGMIDAVE